MSALIFFDIDGTLCGECALEMPENTLQALKAAQAKGHKLFLNTGRTPAHIDSFLREAGFDGMVMSGGAHITLGEEAFPQAELSHEESLHIRNAFYESGFAGHYEGNTAIWFERDRIDAHAEARRLFDLMNVKGLARFIDPADPDFRFVKMYLFSEEEAPLAAINEAFGHRFDLIDRRGTPRAWELNPAGFSKATGIEFVRRHYGAPLSDCYALGDSTNDLAMLRHVPNSIAMGNAVEEVKQACSYVTAAWDDDGVGKALRHFGLI